MNLIQVNSSSLKQLKIKQIQFMDVGHGGTRRQPNGGKFAKAATAWYKWQLKDDREAGKMFTGDPFQLSKSTVWKVDKKNLP